MKLNPVQAPVGSTNVRPCEAAPEHHAFESDSPPKVVSVEVLIHFGRPVTAIPSIAKFGATAWWVLKASSVRGPRCSDAECL